MSLQDKVAVVSGASQGIGREIALSLARAGVRVKALARSAAGLEETKGLAEGAPGSVQPVRLPGLAQWALTSSPLSRRTSATYLRSRRMRVPSISGGSKRYTAAYLSRGTPGRYVEQHPLNHP